MNQYYYDELIASMTNEPNNDDYYYHFKIKGSLPNGIDTNIDYRTLSFEGWPLEVVTFEVKIILIIDPFYQASTVCITYRTSKEFVLTVEWIQPRIWSIKVRNYLLKM